MDGATRMARKITRKKTTKKKKKKRRIKMWNKKKQRKEGTGGHTRSTPGEEKMAAKGIHVIVLCTNVAV